MMVSNPRSRVLVAGVDSTELRMSNFTGNVLTVTATCLRAHQISAGMSSPTMAAALDLRLIAGDEVKFVAESGGNVADATCKLKAESVASDDYPSVAAYAAPPPLSVQCMTGWLP